MNVDDNPGHQTWEHPVHDDVEVKALLPARPRCERDGAVKPPARQRQRAPHAAIEEGEADIAGQAVREMAGGLAEVAVAHDELVELAVQPARTQARTFDPQAPFVESVTLEDRTLCLQVERSLDGLTARYWALLTLTDDEPKRLEGSIRSEYHVAEPHTGFDTSVETEVVGLTVVDTGEVLGATGGMLRVRYTVDGREGAVDLTYLDEVGPDSVQVSGY